MRRTGALSALCLIAALCSAAPGHAKEVLNKPARSAAPASPAPAPSSEPAIKAAPEPSEPPHATAPAQPEPPPADLTEQAKQLYLLGAEAFAAQRNADAIRYFRQAEKLVPSAKLTYNIALAYDEMGDSGRALSEYRAFLVREPHSPHREEALARVSTLQQSLAAQGVQQLSITSDPPGATLRVDGELLGLTPWAGELPPGQHRVQLERSGHLPRETQLMLAAEQAADLHLSLATAPAAAVEQPSTWTRIQPLSWGMLGVGAGALAGGIAFELSRASSSERAGNASSVEARARAEGAADSKQMASLLLLGAGGAFLIGGGVLLVLDVTRAHPGEPAARAGSEPQIALPCSAGFCGVTAQGTF
jgi:tetratricopeptide (TPR) repeat protein